MDDLRERLEAALQLVHDLAQGKRSWTLSVPARPDYDPDLVLSSTLRDALDHPERLSAPSATAATSEFVMVPREPTDAMVAAYLKAQREDCDGQDRFIGALPQGGVQQACKAGYRALIAAAPQAAPVEKGAIRDAALEEAAKEVDWHACRYLDSNLNSIAAGIRALKGPRMKGGEPK